MARDFSETRITDAGLSKLADLKKLKKLYITKTKATPDSVKALKQLPELEIKNE